MRRDYTAWNAEEYSIAGLFSTLLKLATEYQLFFQCQSNTIDITYIKNRAGELATADFQTFGSTWRILVYPAGKDNSHEGLSIYLHHKGREEQKTFSGIETIFRITCFARNEISTSNHIRRK